MPNAENASEITGGFSGTVLYTYLRCTEGVQSTVLNTYLRCTEGLQSTGVILDWVASCCCCGQSSVDGNIDFDYKDGIHENVTSLVLLWVLCGFCM